MSHVDLENVARDRFAAHPKKMNDMIQVLSCKMFALPVLLRARKTEV